MLRGNYVFLFFSIENEFLWYLVRMINESMPKHCQQTSKHHVLGRHHICIYIYIFFFFKHSIVDYSSNRSLNLQLSVSYIYTYITIKKILLFQRRQGLYASVVNHHHLGLGAMNCSSIWLFVVINGEALKYIYIYDGGLTPDVWMFVYIVLAYFYFPCALGISGIHSMIYICVILTVFCLE